MRFNEPKEALYRLNSAWGQTPGHFGWSNVLGSDPKSDFVAACAEGLGHGGANQRSPNGSQYNKPKFFRWASPLRTAHESSKDLNSQRKPSRRCCGERNSDNVLASFS